MSALNLLKASLFSTAQTAWLIVIAVVIVLLIAGNVFLWYYFHKAGERKLCTRQLQQRREELLQRLVELRTGKVPAATEGQMNQEEPEDFAEEEDEDEEEEDKPSAESEEGAASEDGEDGDEELTTEVLPVTAMSAEMRSRFGLTGEEHENKKFVVRYSYSFEARLRNADAEVQARYVDFANEVGLYKGVKIKNSYKQQRIFKGKKTLGLILFRGKTLCVAFALNPSDYVETKYRGLDKSKKKRFEKTPMLYKISSARRLEYAKYLLLQVADKNTIVMSDEPQTGEYNLQPIGRDDMYASGLMRINIVREFLDEAESEAAVVQTEEQVIPEAAVEPNAVAEEPIAQPAEEAPVAEAPAEEAPAEPKAEE
ncbi:MAG: hypothetical protein K2J30_02005 [Clostridia bacterium]|nr:hypothetical protein [Clostridia bacterium]